MTHNEWLEEYVQICAAIYRDLERTGRLDEVLGRQERTRTEPRLKNNDIPVVPFSHPHGSNPES